MAHSHTKPFLKWCYFENIQMHVQKHLNTCPKIWIEQPQFFFQLSTTEIVLSCCPIKTFERTQIQQTLRNKGINSNFIVVMVKWFVSKILEVRNI